MGCNKRYADAYLKSFNSINEGGSMTAAVVPLEWRLPGGEWQGVEGGAQ